MSNFIKEFRSGGNVFIKMLDLFQASTNSLTGSILLLVDRDLAILAPGINGEEKIPLDLTNFNQRLLPNEYQNTIYEKVIQRKKAIISEKCPNLQANFFVHVPIFEATEDTDSNDNKILGIVTLGRNSKQYQSFELTEIVNNLDLLGVFMDSVRVKFQLNSNRESASPKDIFMAHMSHEIRTPLNGIVGYIQLMMRQALTKDQRQYLTSMYQCCVSLIRIINNILDYSQLTSGSVTLDTDCFKLADCISDVQSTLAMELKEKQHKVVVEIDSDIAEFIVMDRQKLMQILINLVSNAIKYTSNKGELKIKIDPSESADVKLLTFNISDNGIGIPKEDQQNLFKPFAKGTQRKFNSTGLGLSITYYLVKILGGKITVNSQVGLGTSVKFTCKYQSQDTVLAEIAEKISSDENLMVKKNILIVNDKLEDRIKLVNLLSSWKLIATPISNINEALMILEKSLVNFDMALIDVGDATSNSSACNELAAKIHKHRPYLPLISVNKNTLPVSPEFKFSIQKPFNQVQLFNILSETVKSSPDPSTAANLQENLKLSILITEDNKTNQELLIEVLRTLGYTNLLTADDGFESIRLLQDPKVKIDVILLDLCMPRADGYTVLEFIQKYPKYFNVKNVIPITASILDSDKERCRKYGVTHFIYKPLDINILRTTLTEIK